METIIRWEIRAVFSFPFIGTRLACVGYSAFFIFTPVDYTDSRLIALKPAHSRRISTRLWRKIQKNSFTRVPQPHNKSPVKNKPNTPFEELTTDRIRENGIKTDEPHGHLCRCTAHRRASRDTQSNHSRVVTGMATVMRVCGDLTSCGIRCIHMHMNVQY